MSLIPLGGGGGGGGGRRGGLFKDRHKGSFQSKIPESQKALRGTVSTMKTLQPEWTGANCIPHVKCNLGNVINCAHNEDTMNTMKGRESLFESPKFTFSLFSISSMTFSVYFLLFFLYSDIYCATSS